MKRLYQDDMQFYAREICAIPLRRDPIPSDEKTKAKEFLGFLKGEKLFQTERGIIIPEDIARQYQKQEFLELSEYTPWQIMYRSQTTE